jgi:hypothetical protein
MTELLNPRCLNVQPPVDCTRVLVGLTKTQLAICNIDMFLSGRLRNEKKLHNYTTTKRTNCCKILEINCNRRSYSYFIFEKS